MSNSLTTNAPAQGTESYKHKFAKETLAGWLREVAASADDNGFTPGLSPVRWRVNRGAPHYGIWLEYPVCLDRQNELVGLTPVWDEICDPDAPIDRDGFHVSEFSQAPPSYSCCLSMGLLPIVIFDVAVQHKGSIYTAIEVVHRNGISAAKHGYLSRIARTQSLDLFVVEADWILSHVDRPNLLKATRVVL